MRMVHAAQEAYQRLALRQGWHDASSSMVAPLRLLALPLSELPDARTPLDISIVLRSNDRKTSVRQLQLHQVYFRQP